MLGQGRPCPIVILFVFGEMAYQYVGGPIYITISCQYGPYMANIVIYMAYMGLIRSHMGSYDDYIANIVIILNIQ